MSAETAVQGQLDAYNARDLARFLAFYDDDIRIYRPPAKEPVLAGKAALAQFYASERFNVAGLHAEVVNRMVLGDKVIDHERIAGLRAEAFDVAAVYHVADGLIRAAWFFAAE